MAISMRVALLTAAVAAVMLLLPPSVLLGAAVTAAPRGCTRSCGNISIPYPFGVEAGCYIEDGFNLTCDRSHRPPKLFLGDGTVQVLGISVPNGTVRINSTFLMIPPGDAVTNGTWRGALRDGGPYYLKENRNKLVATGCDLQFLLMANLNYTVSTCSTFCNTWLDGRFVVNGKCSGLLCCQADIIVGFSSYGFQVHQTGPKRDVPESWLSAFIVEEEFYSDILEIMNPSDVWTLPAVLGWTIKHMTCNGKESSPACRSSHSLCKNITNYFNMGAVRGHLCDCAEGYQGNPYVPNGCYDVNECENPQMYPCYGTCENTEGSYRCHCPPGFSGNASIPNGCKDIDECAHPNLNACHGIGICQNFPGAFYCIRTNQNDFLDRKIGLVVGCGASLFLLPLGAPFLTRKIKLHKEKKIRERFFKQNHGLLLHQLMSQKSDIGGRMIITLAELEKATNNFDASREVGVGGHGVVYKGLLDLQVVAIKKSKIILQRESDDFINEVAILSQINHRNVVKLIGCCLETEVPLLVYEFISNGTLSHHLHVEGLISLSWDDRLRIALEISKALAYLHSATSTPILHRDIKTSNILLDDNLTAKVSDFGASRYIPIDQTGVTTAVQGTIGYLDPMYYYSGRLTNKSDVFSFGVLLVELLTRKKPLYRSNDGVGLISHFTSQLSKGNLVDIIDPQIMEENDGHVHGVAELAAMCTKLNAEYRPTMGEVEMTLQKFRGAKKHVHHNTASWKYDRDQTATHSMLFEGPATETSRQYTIEEEILSSERYPR